MSKLIDLVGNRYGRLVVLEKAQSDKHSHTRWLCQCDCGNQKIVDGGSLKKGLTKSCGCLKKEKLKQYNDSNVVNEVGNTYGYLTVVRRAEDSEATLKDGRAQWICRCKCGNEIITTGKLLRDGHKLSCGCMKKTKGELQIELLLEKQEINYAEQYTVYIEQNNYEIKQKHPYYFDFAILDNNKQLLYLIEYDGLQHFIYKENSDFWNNKDQFNKTQIRDQLKNQWCKDNNIPLIRIPYTHLDNICIEDLKLETSKFII